MAHTLQHMWVKPRQNNDPRLAKTDNLERTIGDDGKLYILANKEDYRKYKCFDDDSHDFSYALSSRGPASSSSTRPQRPRSAQAKFQTPYNNDKLSKSKRPLKESSQTFGKEDNIYILPKKDYFYDSKSITEYEGIEDALNTNTNEQYKMSGLGVSQNAENRVSASIEFIQTKYEQNLEVISALYTEKKQMELRMMNLERALHVADQSRRYQHNSEDSSRERDYSSAAPEKQNEDSNIFQAASNASSMALSAAEVASMFNDSRSASPAHLGDKRFSRSQSFDDRRPRSAGRLDTNQNSLSCDVSSSRSVSSGRFVVSAQLQADQDRYLQRRRAVEKREKDAKDEQARYEAELRERTLRASMKGAEFTAMSQRSQYLDQQRQQKMRTKHEAIHSAEQEALAERRRKIQEHVNKPLLKHELTWKEHEAAEEVKRRERVAKKVQESAALVRMSAASSYNPDSRRSSRVSSSYDRRPSTASAGGQGARNSMSTGDEWGNGQQQGALSTLQRAASVAAMERRQAECAARKQLRLDAQRRREEKLRMDAAEEQKRKIDKIMKMKIPDSARKLTRAAEERTRKIHERLELEKKTETERLRQLRLKAKQEKEAAAVIKTMIALNEEDRKAKHGGYVELGATEQIAREKAREGKEQYRQALMANKAKLKEAQARRPSLIQRHDQAMAVQAAGASALLRVASATARVSNGRNKDANDFYDDDLFEDDEKIILRSRQSGGAKDDD